MATQKLKTQIGGFANNVGRVVSILGGASVLIGGIVLLAGPNDLLSDSFVWSIPIVGQPLQYFWDLGYKGITNQRIVGMGLTIIGLHYFKFPHAIAWALNPIPLVGDMADKALEWYMTVFQYVENIFIPRLTIEDSVMNTKAWQENYREFEKEYNTMRNKAVKVKGGTFVPN